MHHNQDLSQPVQAAAQGALDLAIVILNYNTAGLLRDCLQSVLASRTNLRVGVCVVDNASTDGSAELVRAEFPDVHLIVNRHNVGYSAGNNIGLNWFGFGERHTHGDAARPRYALLLNPDTVVPPDALERMAAFLDARPAAGVAGPRVRRPDGSLDRACRRSFPTPQISFYRMTGLSRIFPKSKRFNAYNLEYLPEDVVHPVDSVVGAFMLVRGEAIEQAGLLDEEFFMYGEDLDWAKRIKDAGWEVWYNGQVSITHVKAAASRQSVKSRIDFYEAMWIFYRKHYRSRTGWLLDKLILLGVVGKGSADVGRHLWRFCRASDRQEGKRAAATSPQHSLPPATSA
ncbi:MAG: glycosyltransferase family 2 protein [Chloroflexota bacterium]|nr:glycosyltransferase family 2 protein [Chloroflexota bacterium]